MTEHEHRLVFRGMSIARGLLINTSCTHHGLIKEYQNALAEGLEDLMTAAQNARPV